MNCCHETKKTWRRASSNSSWLFGSVWTREKLPAGHPGDTARSKYISHTNCSSRMPVDISSTHNTTFSSKPECSSNNVICPKDKMWMLCSGRSKTTLAFHHPELHSLHSSRNVCIQFLVSALANWNVVLSATTTATAIWRIMVFQEELVSVLMQNKSVVVRSSSLVRIFLRASGSIKALWYVRNMFAVCHWTVWILPLQEAKFNYKEMYMLCKFVHHRFLSKISAGYTPLAYSRVWIATSKNSQNAPLASLSICSRDISELNSEFAGPTDGFVPTGLPIPFRPIFTIWMESLIHEIKPTLVATRTNIAIYADDVTIISA